jgi:hypothetical protein
MQFVISNAYMIYGPFRSVGLQSLRNQESLPMDKNAKYLNNNTNYDLVACDVV